MLDYRYKVSGKENDTCHIDNLLLGEHRSQSSAVQYRGMEETSRLGRSDHVHDTLSSCTLTEHSDSVRITTECSNVIPDPL